MDTQKNENFDELLKQFFDGETAKKVCEDITKGEQFLRDYPAPVPDEEAMIVLKAEVAKVAAANRARALRQTYYRVAVFAAAVIVIAFVSVSLLKNKPVKPVPVATTANTSEDDGLFNSDTEFETLSAEVEQVRNEIAALQWEVVNENWDSEITELEANLIEVDSDFWKG